MLSDHHEAHGIPAPGGRRSGMDRDLAKHVVTVSIKTASRLGDLVPLLREHMPPQEYEVHAKAIARAVYAIGHEVTEQIFAEHPDLEQEIEAEINKFGLVI
jgi:hypothetical protein